MTRRFWHYTCTHGSQGIEEDGFIRPNRQPLLGCDLAWFTDLTPPDRRALGLTSSILSCDRTERRYEVDPQFLQPWTRYRRHLIADGRKAAVLELEEAPGVMPAHWWVASCYVQVIRDAEDWRTRAACRYVDPDLFFPADWEQKPARLAREADAKAVCDFCPVRAHCLMDAITRREPWGVGGGLTEAERTPGQALRAGRKPRPGPTRPTCGTGAGTTAHRRAGEPICTACRDHEYAKRDASYHRTWTALQRLVRRGLTLAEAADRLDVTPNTLGKIRGGAKRHEQRTQRRDAAA